MKRSSYLIFLVALIASHPRPIPAMNWEGHDDWLRDEEHSRQLQKILPKAPRPLFPNCDERLTLSDDNPYEQRPVPGKNCHSGGSSGTRPDHH